ncbi:MAG: glycosyl hydrolase family 17 [Cyclobacteriaceae bacterium]
MNTRWSILPAAVIAAFLLSCNPKEKNKESMQSQNPKTAKEILGNPEYQAMCYGGYRQPSRDVQPSLEQLKEDMRILSAMGIKFLRTYNVQLAHAGNMLKAISEIKKETPGFEMYVMLGAWIDCKNAWTDMPVDHNVESEHNEAEIARAVALANQYSDIVKVIAVGNEAMVKWATSYYVQPGIILKWVNHIQTLKEEGKLSKDLWVTSSDNFASWGGGSDEYHVENLNKLIKAVDYISMHTYPMHDTHYNPVFWKVEEGDTISTKQDLVEKLMDNSLNYAKSQYESVKRYMLSIGVDKPIHIGETGWASSDNKLYGIKGANACDEYKEGLFYHALRDWTNKEGISCFYFEAFNENWKDSRNQGGSENHFGLFTLEGKAKYALWDLVDQGAFTGLSRDGNPINKTYEGNKEALFQEVLIPSTNHEMSTP